MPSSSAHGEGDSCLSTASWSAERMCQSNCSMSMLVQDEVTSKVVSLAQEEAKKRKLHLKGEAGPANIYIIFVIFYCLGVVTFTISSVTGLLYLLFCFLMRGCVLLVKQSCFTHLGGDMMPMKKINQQ